MIWGIGRFPPPGSSPDPCLGPQALANADEKSGLVRSWPAEFVPHVILGRNLLDWQGVERPKAIRAGPDRMDH